MLNHHEKLFIFLTLAIVFVAPVLFSQINYQTDYQYQAVAGSPDAIAIRVISDTNHYSALRWYKEQQFNGSPQSIIVDGYEGIRDGRTVYVDVGNVSGSTLFTNINLISYNQTAENATVDIFGQILQHWKFNSNVQTSGTCNVSLSTFCLITSDCPKGEYCLSPKAKIIRDVRRLADLADLKTAVEAYKTANGLYPKLSSGTYLPNKTVSTWPSWQETFGASLGTTLPVDPINQLGNCGGANYNPITCWDENTKRFAGAVGAGTITLPAGSFAYAYSSSADGSSYNLYLTTESGVLQAGGNFQYSGNGGGSGGTGNNGTPTAPSVSCSTMSGNTGRPFTGYVTATDPQGSALTWQLDPSGSSWTGWSASPVIQNTGLPNQKQLWSLSAGAAGSYTIKVTVINTSGMSAFTNCPIVIGGNCGDGIITGSEQCDSGAANTNTPCVPAYGSYCSYCNTNCSLVTLNGGYFGDGIINGPEQCEPGMLNGQSCATRGFSGGTLSCSAPGTFNTSGCVGLTGSCGDGVINGAEECDNGGANTNTACVASYGTTCNYCDTTCHAHLVTGPYYGDGIINGSEQCDTANLNGQTCLTQGFYSGNLACKAPGVFDTTGCSGRCGDNIVQAANGEQCDGNSGPCTALGPTYTTGTYTCNANCTYNTSACINNCIFGTSTIGNCVIQ